MSKNKKNKGLVWSTNPDFNIESDENEQPVKTTFANQKVYVSIDRKARKGKEVTLVEGYNGSTDSLKDIAKLLKSKCGVGGTAKQGVIMIQGNHKKKVIEILEKEGFGKVIPKGGG